MDFAATNLTVTRATRTVFTGLGLAVEAGGALILSGPNGSGKSTLLRAIAGMIPLDSGDVRFGEQSLRDDAAGFSSNLLYAGHLDALKPAFTATETLAFHAALYGADATKIPAALAALDLGFLANQPVRVLSAGQKRRLGLARLALIERPVWLLDEPTVSLDTRSAALVADMARAHCAKGGIVLAATHIDLGIGEATLNPADFAPNYGHDTVDDPVLAGEAW